MLTTLSLIAGLLLSPPPGPVLVELYTSEGCSSCPPADDLLAELRARDASVHVLAFHVDYWDRLGWPDPYARPEFTARQEARSRRGLYTPQAIVNGAIQLVGSDRAGLRAAIENARATAATVRVTVEAKRRGREVEARAKVAPVPNDGARLSFALVEDGLVSDVKRGENAGRTLRHEAVVRALVTRAAAAEVTASLSLPADAVSGKVRVVAWVERGADHTLLGAGEAMPQ